MVRPNSQRVLLIGDRQRELYGALLHALPGIQVISVSTMFDGIAELSSNGSYSAVLAAVEPIERRPESAVRTLRDLAADGRLILFGNPTFELLARKMLQFGCDDYMITPPSAAELQQVFASPALRLAGTDQSVSEQSVESASRPERSGNGTSPAESASHGTAGPRVFDELPLAELILDAMLQQPHDAVAATAREISSRIGLEMRHAPAGSPPPAATADAGRKVLTHALNDGQNEAGTLQLLLPEGTDEAAGRHLLAQFSHLFSKLAELQDRHNQLQRLAITDELTGLYNGRYFRHFLARITEKARQMRFPVTLLLFDIDDFKKYNDQFGHGIGDDILRKTGALMRRCCRDHDLVARIGGDEFAVVFWDKEGPRQPREPRAGAAYRPPQTPVQVFERFRRLMNNHDFDGLGATGRGTLGISAGLAVFPYDAQDVPTLIKKADERLMFGAKACGKNRIYLVGGKSPPATEDATD